MTHPDFVIRSLKAGLFSGRKASSPRDCECECESARDRRASRAVSHRDQRFITAPRAPFDAQMKRADTGALAPGFTHNDLQGTTFRMAELKAEVDIL
jgi:hypothetical protein